MFNAQRSWAVTTLVLTSTLASSATADTFSSNEPASAVIRVDQQGNTSPAGLHILRHDEAAAEVVVELVGGPCSGTPIADTVYVVTAAHCVLTRTGEVRPRTVIRDGVRYHAAAVLVDLEYHEHPSAELDAAVLIMEEVIPGPAAHVGTTLPDQGQLTLAGFQAIDSDGSLIRPRDVHDRLRLTNATGSNIVPYRPAGCVVRAAELERSDALVRVPCGLIPGASGGGLYEERDGELLLVGILSWVSKDMATNGVVPLASLHELLDHPERYIHEFDTEQPLAASERP
jgi:hypothetical protein